MENWSSLIQQANLAFAAGQLDQSYHLYLQCIEVSKQNWERWFQPKQSCNAIVTSYHNLAHLLIKQGFSAEAESYLLSLQEFLTQAMAGMNPSNQRYCALQDAIDCNSLALRNNRTDGETQPSGKLLPLRNIQPQSLTILT